MTQDKTFPHIKVDERNHAEKTLLDQLAVLVWEVIDIGKEAAGV